jgi:hypothetical protein
VTPGYASYPPQDVLSALVDEAESGPVVLAAPDRVVRGLLVAAMRLGDLADPQALTARHLRSRRGGLWILSWREDALVGLQYFPSLAAPALPTLTLTGPAPGGHDVRTDPAVGRPRFRGPGRRSR